MSTTTQKAGRKNFVDFDEFIEFQLKKTSSSIKLTDILTALAGVAAMVIGYLLVFVVFDHWVVDGGFGNGMRWLMLGGLLAAATAWVIWKVVLPARRNVTGLYAARTIEQTEPELKSGLVNLVDLQRAGRDVPSHIRAAMEKQTAVALAKTNIDEAVDRRPLMRLSYALLALVVLFCLYTLISPKTISGSIWRALMPASDTAVDTTIKIDKVSVVLTNPQARDRANGASLGEKLLPADVTVPARSKLEVVVDLLYSDDPPENVVLYFTTQDGKFRDVPVEMKADPDEVKRFRGRLTGEYGRGILQNTTYRIVAGDAKAGPFTITVTHPPIATVRSLSYRYPEYMGLDSKTQQGGHIDAWEGTAVSVKAVTDRPVREAWVVFHDTEDITRSTGRKLMTISGGTQLSVDLVDDLQFRPDGGYPRFYHILCKDKTGLTDPRPVMYGITLHRDMPPKIEVIDPAGNEIDLPSNTETLPILYQAKDPDFKLKFVTLQAEITRAGKEGQKPETHAEMVSKKSAKSLRETFSWALKPFRAKPGDSLRFRLEARDNKAPVANLGFSRWVTVRFVEPVDQEQLKKELERKQEQQNQKKEQQERNENGDMPPPNGEQDPNQKGNPDGDKKQPENKKQPGNKEQPGNKQDAGKQDGTGKSNKKSPGGKENPDKANNPEQGMNENQPGNNGNSTNPQKPNPDGGLSEDQLREFNQQRMKDENNKNPQKKNDPGNNTKPGQKPNGDPNPGNQPKENTPDGMGERPGPKKDNPGNPKNDTRKDPSNTEPKKKSEPKGKGETPQGMGDKKTEKTNPDGMPNENKMGEGNANPKQQPGMKTDEGDKKKQKSQGGNAGGQKQDPAKQKTPKKKSANDAGSKGTPMNPDNVKPDGTKDGGGTQQKRDPSKSAAKESKDPVNGKSEPAPGKKAKRKKSGTGDETGKADPNADPKANPTQSKKPNDLKTDPKKKKVTKQSTDNGDPKIKKQGSQNPGNTKQKTGMKKAGDEKPDMKSTTPKNTDGKTPKQQPKENPPGNEELKGDEKPKQRKSDKAEGGKKGSNRPSDQGVKGSKKRGAGDKTDKPGNRGQNDGMKKGQPGNKPGKGSTKRQTDGMQPGQGEQPPMNTKSNSGESKPGQNGGKPSSNPDNKLSPQGKPGGGTGPFDKVREGKNPPPQAPDEATPRAKSEYGEKAVDLTLKYLEDQLKRGKTDEKWLKEHGFSSKEQLKNAIDRTRKQRENAALNAKQKQQRDLFYRSLYDEKFLKKSGVERGSNVRKRDVAGVGKADNSEPPPTLKDYYRSFTESIGGNKKK